MGANLRLTAPSGFAGLRTKTTSPSALTLISLADVKPPSLYRRAAPTLFKRKCQSKDTVDRLTSAASVTTPLDQQILRRAGPRRCIQGSGGLLRISPSILPPGLLEFDTAEAVAPTPKVGARYDSALPSTRIGFRRTDSVRKRTAPKYPTLLRVGACSRTGSLISGGIHMRQREPCC